MPLCLGTLRSVRIQATWHTRLRMYLLCSLPPANPGPSRASKPARPARPRPFLTDGLRPLIAHAAPHRTAPHQIHRGHQDVCLWGPFSALLVNHAPAHPPPCPPEHSLTRFVSGIFLMVFSRVGKPLCQYTYCVRTKKKESTQKKKKKSAPHPGLACPGRSPLPRRSVPLQAPASLYIVPRLSLQPRILCHESDRASRLFAARLGHLI